MNIKITIQNKISWLFRKLFVSVLYENKVGIKCFNQIISSDMFDYFITGNSQIISTDNLYFLFDGLKDHYTLIDTPLLESPHFDLVKSIITGKDIRTTEYVYRRENGTLDFRQSARIKNNYIHSLQQKFNEKVKLIESGEYDPIKIVSISGKYYIADGKHTAATCALLGTSPECVDITPVLFDSFFWWVHQKMLNSKGDYKKHMQWFKNAKKANI